MEGLKRLKEIEFGRNEKEDRGFLKQEAIKHVKNRRERMHEIVDSDELPSRYIEQNQAAIAWIKEFFSITEEDLK